MAKRKKTPPEVWERQQANIDHLRALLRKREADDARMRASGRSKADG